MSPFGRAVVGSPWTSCKDEVNSGSIVGCSSTRLLVPDCVSLLPGSMFLTVITQSVHTVVLSDYLRM